MAIIGKFDVSLVGANGRLLYSDCTLIDTIPPNRPLTDDEVRKWFGIDEDHKHWDRAHRPNHYTRYVFDKCIVPDSPCYRIEVSY